MDISTDNVFEFCAEENDIGERLDKVLTERLDGEYSRTEVQQFIKEGLVLVNQNSSKPAYRLEAGDCVYVNLPEEQPFEVLPEDIPLEVIYEDDTIAIIHKPAGMVVHPAHGNEHGTLVNALLYRYPNIAAVGEETERAGIVHRLDKDVSGVMVVALSNIAHRELVAQFQARTIEKHYIALVENHPSNEKGRIDAPIGRDPRHRKRMAVLRDGKEAVTEFQVREYYGERALLDVFPHTGRTHQIRVHLAFINCPIVGDNVYGYRKQRIKMNRIFLHAYRIAFEHPLSHEHMIFEVPLPNSLQNILEKLPK